MRRLPLVRGHPVLSTIPTASIEDGSASSLRSFFFCLVNGALFLSVLVPHDLLHLLLRRFFGRTASHAEPSLQSVQSEQAGESSVQAPVVQDPVSEAGKFGGSHSEPSSIEADVRLPTAETPTEGEASDALLGEQHVSSEQDTEATAVEAEADS